MAKKSGSKIFLIILGFLVLAGGLALIALGLLFIMPDIAEFFKALPTNIYYLAGGIAGILVSVIILILAFKMADKKTVNLTSKETGQDPNVWNTEKTTNTIDLSTPIYSPSINPTPTIPNEKRANEDSLICEKCGTENAKDNYYCTGCKSALKKICKLCGYDNPNGTEICKGCKKVM